MSKHWKIIISNHENRFNIITNENSTFKILNLQHGIDLCSIYFSNAGADRAVPVRKRLELVFKFYGFYFFENNFHVNILSRNELNIWQESSCCENVSVYRNCFTKHNRVSAMCYQIENVTSAVTGPIDKPTIFWHTHTETVFNFEFSWMHV